MCKKIGVKFKEYNDFSKLWYGYWDDTERDNGTWVKVCTGIILTNKSDH